MSIMRVLPNIHGSFAMRWLGLNMRTSPMGFTAHLSLLNASWTLRCLMYLLICVIARFISDGAKINVSLMFQRTLNAIVINRASFPERDSCDKDDSRESAKLNRSHCNKNRTEQTNSWSRHRLPQRESYPLSHWSKEQRYMDYNQIESWTRSQYDFSMTEKWSWKASTTYITTKKNNCQILLPP